VVGIKDKRFLWIAFLIYSLFLSWAWTFVLRYHDDVLIVGGAAGDDMDPFNATDTALVGIHSVLSMFAVRTSDIKTGVGQAELEDLSSVDYYACCGLGHRLIRMTLAAYVARQHNFTLRNFWGWCGERQPVEVFSYLFRPVPAGEVAHVTSRNLVMPFYNEVPGFPALVREAASTIDGTGHPNSMQQHRRQVQPADNPHHYQSTADPAGSCHLCPADKVQSDLELYTSLRDRFRHKQMVDDFVEAHFANATVIGIHVRAGNNEGGDFEQKGRAISNPDLWVEQIQKLVEEQLLGPSMVARGRRTSDNNEDHDKPLVWSKPPIIYLATDTPSMVTRFRRQFASINITVVDMPQNGRAQEGKGVLFGESNKVHNKGDMATQGSGDDRHHEEDHQNTPNGDESGGDDYSSCLKGWSDTVTDMLLLSHADVVIAGKPSSFVQTLPMSLAFGKPMELRKATLENKVYCEVIPRYRQITSVLNGSASTIVDGGRAEWEAAAPAMQCYGSYAEWCCNHTTWIRFRYKGPKGRDKVIAKEFVRFPLSSPAGVPNDHHTGMRNRTSNCQRPRRGRGGGGWRDKCLPHAWV
jgi:hypothetical protein